MYHIIEKIFSLFGSDLESYLNQAILYLSEEERADCFEILMETAADLLSSPNPVDLKLAEKAEFAASMLVPYDDHSLRGRIRFNDLDNKSRSL